MKNSNTNKIVIFLSIEFLLVAVISLPLFIFKAESGSTLVMAVSVIFMWLPALTTVLTRKITNDKSDLLLKPKFKKNWKLYVISAYIPGIAVLIGVASYFVIFPNHLDLTLGFVQEMAETAGEQITIPSLTISTLFLVSIGLVILAPLVFVNHILAFGEEIGWRAYLMPLLCQKLGNTKGILLDGVLWGIVHAPLVYFGVNYSGNYWGTPWTGMLMMSVFAMVVNIFLSYLTIKSESIIPACIAHGVINAIREAPLFICISTYNALLGPKPSGIIGMIGFIVLGIIILLKIKKENPVYLSEKN